jgi:hypothetical protein
MIGSRSWEAWNIVTTMLELVNAKLESDPHQNPTIRSWEIWKKGGHKRSMVYRVIDELNSLNMTRPTEPELGYDFEVRFLLTGILSLKAIVSELPRRNRLQRIKVEVLSELLDEVYRKLKGSIP